MSDTAPADLQKAFALHRKGDYPAAERLYQAILEAAPRHFDALHLLGVLHAQTGRLPRAAELLGEAIRVRPDEAAAQFNLGSTLRRLGRPAEALACFDKAIVLNEAYADAHFGRANALLELGRRADAVAGYDRVIALEPDHVEAETRRATTLRALGRFPEALDGIDRVLARKGDRAELHRLRGLLLADLQRPEEAIAAYDRAIELDPRDGESLTNRGNLLRDVGRLHDALASHDRAIAAQADRAEFHVNRGATHAALRRFDEALRDYDRALALKPDFAEAHVNRGAVMREIERLDEALAAYDRAIVLAPDLAVAHGNRGIVLRQLDRLDESLASHDRAVALEPGNAEAHNNRGVTLQELQRFDEALASCDRALALAPDLAAAYVNRGIILRQLDRLGESLAHHDKAVALAPDSLEAHSNRGAILLELQKFDEALASYDRALALRADWREASWNKAQLLLLRGDFERGWPLYEVRRVKPEFPAIGDPEVPSWQGAGDLAGKSVLVHWEQGFGDTIQFCRYLALLRRRAARVVFAPQRALTGLMRSLGPDIEVVDPTGPLPRCDVRVPLLSLPLALGTTLPTIPSEVPYLRAEDDRVGRWRQRLVGPASLRVGVAWQGRRGPVDRGRSYPLAALAGLSRLPDVRLISLQKGEGLEQLADLPDGMRVETPGDDFDAGREAFLDTAAIMTLCDLVVTSDTAIAHLAGALGIRTWVALKAVPDWRWLLDRPDSPWYPTMRLFRQASPGDWRPVFGEIEAELRNLVGTHGQPGRAGAALAPRIPVSWGEVIDKITILEIKVERLKDARAHANVVRELDLLAAIAGPQLAASPDLAARKAALRTVNEALWDVEDALRRREAAGRFDDEFVVLARSVYRQNDRRAAIKRKISELLASEIVEEKSYERY